MKPFSTRRRARGAVLVVGMIMLVLITLLVTMAFKFSTVNLKSVGNMQARHESIAAANKAIEQVIGSWDFGSTPVADQIDVDIDNNGSTDYVVSVAAPVCVKSTRSTSVAAPDSEVTYDNEGNIYVPPGQAAVFNVVIDFDATAVGAGGTQVRVHQGISKSLSLAQCSLACPPAAGGPCS